MVKAILKNHRQSPRKVRLVADLVRGKDVGTAINTLMFTPKRAALSVKKVLLSAVANAKNNNNLDERDLFVKEISVDDGFTLKRWRARARGSSARIRKRTSHIVVTLDTKTKSEKEAPKASVKEVTEEKTEAKKATPKKVTKTAKKTEKVIKKDK